MTTPDGLHQRLTAAAAGLSGTEAAAIILTRSMRGALPGKLLPVIDDDPTEGLASVDWAAAINEFCQGVLSGGERRLVELAASLATGHPIDARDVFTGVDNQNASIALTALAHCLQVPPPPPASLTGSPERTL